MLAQPHRLRRSADLRQVMRRGRRFTSPHLVLHILARPDLAVSRAGFVVGKVVGNSVQRHRVIRQLRHIIAGVDLPSGSDIVVRALEGAHGAPLQLELSDLLAKAGLHA